MTCLPGTFRQRFAHRLNVSKLYSLIFYLGNARGTKYSTEHAKIDCNSDEFWQFSFNEIGYYDVSAMLDFVLDHTKEKTTFYCGHSQGCSSLLALLSSQPDYNAKISQAHLLTPAIFMNNCSMPWMLMAAKRADLIMVKCFHCFSFLLIQLTIIFRNSLQELEESAFRRCLNFPVGCATWGRTTLKQQ